jgi:hypothetical protein
VWFTAQSSSSAAIGEISGIPTSTTTTGTTGTTGTTTAGGGGGGGAGGGAGGGGAGGGGGGAGAGAGGAPGYGIAPQAKLVVAASASVSKKRVLTLSVTCAKSGPACTGSATFSYTVKSGKHSKKVTLGRAKFSLKAGAKKTLSLRLSKAQVAALRAAQAHARHHRLSITVSIALSREKTVARTVRLTLA